MDSDKLLAQVQNNGMVLSSTVFDLPQKMKSRSGIDVTLVLVAIWKTYEKLFLLWCWLKGAKQPSSGVILYLHSNTKPVFSQPEVLSIHVGYWNPDSEATLLSEAWTSRNKVAVGWLSPIFFCEPFESRFYQQLKTNKILLCVTLKPTLFMCLRKTVHYPVSTCIIFPKYPLCRTGEIWAVSLGSFFELLILVQERSGLERELFLLKDFINIIHTISAMQCLTLKREHGAAGEEVYSSSFYSFWCSKE